MIYTRLSFGFSDRLSANGSRFLALVELFVIRGFTTMFDATADWPYRA